MSHFKFYSALFISNLLFAKGGGYFDTAEHTKWLLHTWSLSVEWQFYIFFPIIIIVLKKFLSFSNLKHVVLCLFLASFIYCIYATYKDSKTAYFLLTSRAWEMLLGGLAFLYPWSLKNKAHQIITQCLGVVLIIASYFLISKNTPWPGYMAIIPVLGAYLIVVANYQNNFLINNPISNHIGKWSYSIYVWHWPLVVLGFYFTFENWWIYGIPLSILLGFLSYQFIEKINFPRYTSWKEIYKVKPFYIFLIILAFGHTLKLTNGMEFHYSKKLLDVINDVNNKNLLKCDNQTGEICSIGNQNNIKVIVIGDSHASALTTSITTFLDLKNQGLNLISTGGCPFILNSHFTKNTDCFDTNKDRLFLIESKKYANIPVILIARLPYYLEGQNDPERIEHNASKPVIHFPDKPDISRKDLYSNFSKNLETTLCTITKYNPTFITHPVPEIPYNVPRALARSYLTGNPTLPFLSYSDYLKRSLDTRIIIENAAKKCGAQILDPSKVLCDSNRCKSFHNNLAIYSDGDHLNEYGNKLLTPMFKDALKQ